MKNKGLILIIVCFLFIFVTASVIGYYQSDKEDKEKNVESEKTTESTNNNQEVENTESKEETIIDTDDEDNEADEEEYSSTREVHKEKYSYRIIDEGYFNSFDYFKIGNKDISKELEETFGELEVHEYKDLILIDFSSGGTCGPTSYDIAAFDYEGNLICKTTEEWEEDKYDTKLGNYVLTYYEYDETSKKLILSYKVSHYSKFETCDSDMISSVVGHYIDDENNYKDHKWTTKECNNLKKYKDIKLNKSIEFILENNKFIKKSESYSNKFSEEYKDIFDKCN